MRSGTPARTRLKDLTDTQRRVLDLIAQGKTNHEIGQELGITLDGAKYHVTEILNKLGVDSRDEAADWWRRAQRRPAARVSRAMALPAMKWVVVATAAAVVVVVVVVILAALTSDDAPSSVPHIQAAFLVGDDPTATRRIIVVDDQGNQRQVGEEGRYLAVDWAPDGRKIFATGLDGDQLMGWTFDWFSGDSSSWPLGELQWWKWSPDGSLLALLLSDRLAIVRPDGREVASVALPPSTEHSNFGWPVLWSPDSAWVAGTDRDVLAVLNASGDGRVLELPTDFTAEHVALTGWDSPIDVVITDPNYLGRSQADARGWMADVTTSPVVWEVVPYVSPTPPSESEAEEARRLAGVTTEPFRPVVSADGGGMAYVFYSLPSGTQGPVVIAVVVSTDGSLTTLAVPPSVATLGPPRGEVSVVVTKGR